MSTDPEPPPAVGTSVPSVEMATLTLMFDYQGLDEALVEGLDENFVSGFSAATLAAQTKLDIATAQRLELSVQLLDQSQMQALNKEYRGIDSPTNVLSFESGMPLMPGGALCVLGDLVLCPSVIEREAREQTKPVLDHWAHMLVHGALHLCGYDHEGPAEACTMERLEIQILSESGIANPYTESITLSVNNSIVEDQ